MGKRNFLVYILMIMLLTVFVAGCGDSNNIGITHSDPGGINEYNSREWKEAYRNLVEGWTEGEIDPYCDTESLRFDLVYINEDEMPEFVVSGDSWIYMYTYCPGSVASGVSNVNILMEEWWWGTNSNTGYYYIPYENAIRNDHSDEERYIVDYFHMNENFALVDWYSIWYDIVENENGTTNTYFYEGPEILEESVSAEEESTEPSQEQTTGDVSAEDAEANIEQTSKIITKEVTEEEWLTYNFPDKIIEFLGGTLTKDEMLDKIDACVVTMEGAPAFVGLQPIHYVPENDSVHRQNYYDMITLLEDKLPKHNIASEDTEGDVEIINIAEGDIGSDGKKDAAVILKSYDPSVSGWDDYGRYSYTVCVFTEIDGEYKCTAINHNMLANNEQYYEEDDHEYLVEISAGELQVSNTVKDGDNWENCKYSYELKGNSLVLSRLERDYSNQSSGCGKTIVQSVLTGEVVGGAYSDLENSFEAWELYTGTCETAMLTFDKMTLWQIPQVDESLMKWNENAKDYNYKALYLDEYLQVVQNENGEVVETLEPWQKAYLNLLQAIALEQTDIYNKELTYRLIYINEDEIPELVVSQNGYFVSVFTYAPEGQYGDVKEVNVLLENCGYGAMGNVGYYYLPKDNIIYNYNADFAGAAGTTWYGYINENNQLDSKYTIYYEDIDMQDDSEECKYYFNGKEISKDLYETYKIDGNFKFIEGNKKAYEIVEEIMKL